MYHVEESNEVKLQGFAVGDTVEVFGSLQGKVTKVDHEMESGFVTVSLGEQGEAKLKAEHVQLISPVGNEMTKKSRLDFQNSIPSLSTAEKFLNKFDTNISVAEAERDYLFDDDASAFQKIT
eukprot:CAMPEP_0167764464 /NCGR_PEP_ID=MMETSP0110_2-20121227/14049_1 /TAXON_ID=629695 /ORGANISM="Gymnochlora sp., Strain CCMP2014" /LENGTH=121 /DNA_ID=CAMNT_0007651875 /DNA_START=177 /DNA_END=542 /DNA_ORIENTATION=-